MSAPIPAYGAPQLAHNPNIDRKQVTYAPTESEMCVVQTHAPPNQYYTINEAPSERQITDKFLNLTTFTKYIEVYHKCPARQALNLTHAHFIQYFDFEIAFTCCHQTIFECKKINLLRGALSPHTIKKCPISSCIADSETIEYNYFSYKSPLIVTPLQLHTYFLIT